MKHFKSFSAALSLLLLSAFVASATQTVVESARVHTATQVALNGGTNGCAVSGATVATPSVITCTAAHNLQDGDPIQVTGIVGTTTDNVTAFAKVTGYPDVVRRHSIISRRMRPVTVAATWSQHQATLVAENTRCLGSAAVDAARRTLELRRGTQFANRQESVDR